MAWTSNEGFVLLGTLHRMSPVEIGEAVVLLLRELTSYRRVVITDESAQRLVHLIREALQRIDLDVAERALRAWLDSRPSGWEGARPWLMAAVLYAEGGGSLPDRLVERVLDVAFGAVGEGWRFSRWFPEGRAYLEDDVLVADRVSRACDELFACADLERRAEGAVLLIDHITKAFGNTTAVSSRIPSTRWFRSTIEPSMHRLFEALAAVPDTARAIRLAAVVGSSWGIVFPFAARFGDLVPSRAEAAVVLAACPRTKVAAPLRFALAVKADDPERMGAEVAVDAAPEVHVRIAEAFVRHGDLPRAIAYLEAQPPSATRDATLRRLLVEAGRPHDALALYVIRPEDVPHVAEALGLDRAVVIAHGMAHSTDEAAWKRLAAERGVLEDPDELLRGHFEPRDFHATLNANASASPRWIGKLCARTLDLVFDRRSTWTPDDDPRAVLRAIFEAAEAAEPKKAAATRARLATKLRKHAERTPSYLLREAALDVLDALDAPT